LSVWSLAFILCKPEEAEESLRLPIHKQVQ